MSLMKSKLIIGLIMVVFVGCTWQPQQPVRVVVENEVRARVVNDTALATSASVKKPAILGPTVSVYAKPVRTMAAQLELSLKKRGIKSLPIAVAPFVDLNKPGRKSSLGAELAEGFFHELQSRGFNLVDYAATPFNKPSKISKSGLALSDYYRKHRISYVVSGTYIVNSEGVIVFARVLDTVSKQVVATGESQLSVADIEGAIPGYNPMSSREGMIVENAGVPVH